MSGLHFTAAPHQHDGSAGYGVEVRLTVMGLHSLQIQFPPQVLAVDLAHVRHKKSILLPGSTPVGVDLVNPTLQRVVYQGLPIFHAITKLDVIDE